MSKLDEWTANVISPLSYMGWYQYLCKGFFWIIVGNLIHVDPKNAHPVLYLHLTTPLILLPSPHLVLQLVTQYLHDCQALISQSVYPTLNFQPLPAE